MAVNRGDKTMTVTQTPVLLGIRQAKGFDDFGHVYLEGTVQIDPSEQGLWDQDITMTKEEFFSAVERGDVRHIYGESMSHHALCTCKRKFFGI